MTGTYDKAAIVGVGRGVAQLLGVDVQFKEGPPCTDGKTVWMDCTPKPNKLEFEASTGIGIHECAHVAFGSVAHCKDWGKRIADGEGCPEFSQAAHQCVNVVLDIHDETRIAALFPSAGDLLRTNNLLCGHKRRGRGNANNWHTALVVGLLDVRLVRNRGDRWLYGKPQFTKWHLNRMGYFAAQAFALSRRHYEWRDLKALLRKCREPKSVKSKHRTYRSWTAIYEHAKAVFKLIRPYLSAQDEDSAQDAARGKIDPKKGHTPQDGGIPDANGASCDPIGAVRRAKDMPGLPQAPSNQTEAADNGDVQVPGGGASRTGKSGPSNREFDPIFYRRCLVGIDAAADEIMETEESMRMNHRRESGVKLGAKWARQAIDRRPFVARDRGRNAELRLAVLLDRSSSVHHMLGKMQSVTKAFMDSMECHGADTRAWLFGVIVEERDAAGMARRISMDGVTKGVEALTRATRWLQEAPTGRKLCLIITDGEWVDRADVTPVIRRGASHGIEYAAIGLGFARHGLQGTFGHGTPAISCDRPEQLAELLVREIN